MSRRTLALALLAGSVIAALAAAPALRPEGEPTKTPAPALDVLKALAGTWHTPDADRDGKPDGTVTYRVTSGGHAIAETLFPGTPHEMLTVYHMDGPAIVCTHYCTMGNQPRMRCDHPDKGLVFKYQDCCNRAAGEAAMSSLVVTIQDSDHFRQEWTSTKDGQELHKAVFEWTRDRSAGVH